jgi:plastocyanin
MRYLFFSLLVISAIGLFAVPQAFADHDEITIYNAEGSSTPGCEETADGCFIPSVVVLAKADTEITWENNDTAAHTATSGGGEDAPSPDGYWDSSLIMAGSSYTKSFEGFEPGIYDYFCMVHPWMKGTIILEGDGVSAPVVDTVPPTVLVPDDIVIETENPNGAVATFNPHAVDNIDELLTPSCNYQSGSVFAIGTTEIVCTATDSAGNSSSNSFNVIIEFSGVLIPDWIKSVAGFWNAGDINDTSFLEAISYLIENNILVVPPTEVGADTGATVPEWVKNTAGWWSEGQIDDDAFVNALQYLIQQGLIQV